MLKAKIIIIIYFSISLFSCKQNHQQNEIKKITVEFDKNPLELSDYFDLNIIFLNNSINQKIGKIDKVVIHDSLIFILDREVSKSLMVFDLNGNYINKIGSLGKGKGQYLNLKDFDIINNNVHLLSGLDRKLLIYDFNGDLRSQKKLSAHGGYALKCFSDGSFMTVEANSLFGLNFWNKNGKVKSEVTAPKYSFIKFYSPKCISSRENNTAFVNTPFNDTIYRINDNQEIIPMYIFNFGKEKFPIQSITNKDEFIFEKKTKHFSRLESFIESKDFVLASIIRERRFYLGLYIKNENQFLITKKSSFGSIPLSHLVGECKNGAIFSTEAYILKKAIEKNKDEFPEELLGLNNDDNPIILLLNQKIVQQ